MQQHLALISHKIENARINQRIGDGYIDATAMCKAAGKQLGHYNALQTTRDYLAELSRSIGIPMDLLIISVSQGVNHMRGTWIHPRVAVHLAQWCSSEFAVAVSGWVLDWAAGNSRAHAVRPPSATPAFIRRFNENWDRTDPGYFSVIGELGIRLYGRLEMLGHVMPDRGDHGREMRPDVSVGRYFSDWLGAAHPNHCEKRKTYRHKLPGGNECEAYQYPIETLPMFISYVDSVWMRDHAPNYLQDKDPAALAYLPKLLPVVSMPPKAADVRFQKIKQAAKPSEAPVPATGQTAREHFQRMRRMLKIPPPTE